MTAFCVQAHRDVDERRSRCLVPRAALSPSTRADVHTLSHARALALLVPALALLLPALVPALAFAGALLVPALPLLVPA